MLTIVVVSLVFIFIAKPCRNLREMFKIDAADYMMSICGNDTLRELSSPGKSGSVFFLSQDDRFMIKTLRKSEVKVCDYLHIHHLCFHIIFLVFSMSLRRLFVRLPIELPDLLCRFF